MPRLENSDSDTGKSIENEKEKPEYIPTPEEVLSLFEILAGEDGFETLRRLEDEKGLYLWEIKVIQADGSAEHLYIRKGNYRERGLPGGSSPETAIHTIYFDQEGNYINGGGIVYKYIDGKWKAILWPLQTVPKVEP